MTARFVFIEFVWFVEINYLKKHLDLFFDQWEELDRKSFFLLN